MAPFLKMSNITKKFGKMYANKDISFEVQRGEVLALLGENGAGKSTLMNILFGLYGQDDGQIEIEGEKVTINHPRDAIKHKIGMVHQDFMLIPALTSIENVIIGLKSERGPFIDIKTASEKILKIAEKNHLKIYPNVKVSQLSVGLQQQLEILKVLFRGVELLILDEPTSVLTTHETKELFKTIRALAESGKAVIFISHKLNEVKEISDRIVVLRKGELVGEVKTDEATPKIIAQMMAGKEVLFQVKKTEAEKGDVLLKLEEISAMSDRNLQALEKISLSVRSGEIVGIAGVDGNGKKELSEVVAGLRKVQEGKIFVKNKDLTNSDSNCFILNGVCFIPDDRRAVGTFGTFSVAENSIMKNFCRTPFSSWCFLNKKSVNEHARNLISEYDIRPGDISLFAKNLSGGNLQKLVLAREITSKPNVLVAMNPTRGLDVGAIEFVHKQLLLARQEGVGILLISSELDEILDLSDRIAVIYEGQFIASFLPGEYSKKEIGLFMTGTKLDEKEAVL